MIIVDALIAGPRPSGIGVYTFQVIQHFPKTLDFVVLSHSPGLFGPQIPIRRAPQFLRPDGKKRTALFRFLYLQTLRGKEVLYRTYHGISLVWRGPQVITIHDILPVLFPDRYPQQSYLFRYILRPWISKVEAIITVSQRSKKDILEYFQFPEDRIYVFYPAYDRQVFHPHWEVQKVQEVKAHYGLQRYLLVVGAQFSHKNVEVVLRALKWLDPSMHLLVIGTREPYASRLRQIVRDLDLGARVTVIPYVPQDELPYLYAGAELLAVPSRYEGFGIPVLEAMAVGTPVVGTEAVREAGGNAMVYADPDDPESWVAAIRNVQENRETIVQKGLEHVQQFSWAKTAAGIAALLKDVEQRSR